ncbi:DUF4062 domain-containing protein [Rossellomorea vietnamensis]|uniref:DUF4062 domain-containing protein n=1 Tax=Rossellomorea vietnamensis TaxID=218284 RepID=A0A5D4K8F7_9BACI|nr:DUF4062 domain-containing protein [Rossellomorea vietnamensis]TYR73139.1 DUF4062 domain-containing protein [Rossellomorea vietnamensis]
MNKKLQVFVSSTYLDLRDERQKAVEGILKSKHIPAGMELFIPSDKSQWEVIKEWIVDSDLLMLILGGRYGSIEPNSGKSYTQLEYEFAADNNIPVCTIVLNEQFLANKKSKNISLKIYEHEVENPSIEKYNAFKKIAMSNLVGEVGDVNQITSEVGFILQEYLRKDKSEYNFRGWIRGKEKPDLVEMNIDNNIRYYIEDKERHGLIKKTLDTYMVDLKIFQNYFSNLLINEIDTMKIKEFLRYREDNYSIRSKNSMERVRSILNGFFEWLVYENKIEVNPVLKVKPYKFHKNVNEGLSNIELSKLRTASKTLRERAMIETFLSSGCHLAELCELKLDSIDWKDKTLNIGFGEKRRIVFLTPTAEKNLKEYLDNRQDDIEFIFVTERKPFRKISHRGIQRELGNIGIRADLGKNISPRIFRDTFVRIMLEKGYQWNTIQVLLGYHSKASRSESYFKITQRNIHDMINPRPDF